MKISLKEAQILLVGAGFGRFYPNPSPHGPETAFMSVLCTLGENSKKNKFFVYVEKKRDVWYLQTLFAPYSNVKVTYSGKVIAL